MKPQSLAQREECLEKRVLQVCRTLWVPTSPQKCAELQGPLCPFCHRGKEDGTPFRMPVGEDAVAGSSCPCFCHREISCSSVPTFTPVPTQRGQKSVPGSPSTAQGTAEQKVLGPISRTYHKEFPGLTLPRPCSCVSVCVPMSACKYFWHRRSFLSSLLLALISHPVQKRGRRADTESAPGREELWGLAVGLRATGRIHTVQITSASTLFLFQVQNAAAGRAGMQTQHYVSPMSPHPSGPSVIFVLCQQLDQAQRGWAGGAEGTCRAELCGASSLPHCCGDIPGFIPIRPSLASLQAVTLWGRDIAVGRRGLSLSGLEDQ